MAKAKMITVLILVAVSLIVLLQNTQPVETNFLFMSATMPRAALLAITMLIGIVVGIIIALGFSRKRNKRN